MPSTNQMDNNGIFLIKDRSYYPKTNKTVKALFYFKSQIEFFNVFFQRTLVNRLDETTQILFVNQASHESLLDSWSTSTKADDTIFDNMLPYPNTKNYAWDCGELCRVISTIRQDHTNTNRGGRPYFRPGVKANMKSHLLSVDHYTIEMMDTTLSRFMIANNLQFSYEFSMPKGLRASTISSTDYSKERLSGDIIGAISKFTQVTPILSNVSSPIPPTTRPPTPYNIGIQEISDHSSDNEDDQEFKIRSSHPTFINEDGTEIPTSPYLTRHSKRQRQSPPVSPLNELPIPVIGTPNQTVFTPTPLSSSLSIPLSRESSISFSPFSPALT